MILESKMLPYLDSTLHTLGLLNQNPITEIMATPVVTFSEIERVGQIYETLRLTKHNGFPIVDREGRFCGLILRKTLCMLLELKAFSAKAPLGSMATSPEDPVEEGGGIHLTVPTLVFYETLEKKYPKYPDVETIPASPEEMV
jgi:hypothetical protein